jgi:putative restriction endonuclease
MIGFVAVTNPDWYWRLAAAGSTSDANFWSPSTRKINLELGTPFFFKLKGDDNAIAGFGYFARHTVLPDWLAWESFGEANGVESLEALKERLARIRRKASISGSPQGLIGCALIAEAKFFAPENWVQTPSDWPPRTQTGARYDLSAGEGRRIWMECQARAAGLGPNRNPAFLGSDDRYGSPVLVAPRLGQPIFRVNVIDAYGRACAVTGEHSLPVLEASHIRPYASGGAHAVSNGLLLRSDIHRLFDRGYVTVDERYRFVVGARLRNEWDNGRAYYAIEGRTIRLPALDSDRPSPAALDWHRNEVFVG